MTLSNIAPMDLSGALGSVRSIRKIIGKLPKHRKCPPVVDRHPRWVLEEAHAETLKRCLPFFARIIKEAKAYLETADEKGLEEAMLRKKYVYEKLEEAKSEFQEQTKKNELIAQIEALEKTNVKKFEKIIVDEEKSKKIIEYLFESNNESSGMKGLKNLIELTFDKTAVDKTDAYEKILQMM